VSKVQSKQLALRKGYDPHEKEIHTYMTNFFVDIGITVILRLLSDGKIPAKYVKALIKVRDALNLAFPPELGNKAGDGIQIVK
jgi:hypothetical protein